MTGGSTQNMHNAEKKIKNIGDARRLYIEAVRDSVSGMPWLQRTRRVASAWVHTVNPLFDFVGSNLVRIYNNSDYSVTFEAAKLLAGFRGLGVQDFLVSRLLSEISDSAPRVLPEMIGDMVKIRVECGDLEGCATIVAPPSAAVAMFATGRGLRFAMGGDISTLKMILENLKRNDVSDGGEPHGALTEALEGVRNRLDAKDAEQAKKLAVFDNASKRATEALGSGDEGAEALRELAKMNNKGDTPS